MTLRLGSTPPGEPTNAGEDARLGCVFAGTSGWAYPTWKPGFYPADVSSKKFLSFYATRLNSVEVNYSFRKLPAPAMLDSWMSSVGDGFRFSFKAPQRITHFSRLRECEMHLDEFLQVLSPVAQAGKLGLVLFQLPPNFKADLPRLESFLQLPALVRWTNLRIAFEFRHASWFSEEAYAILRHANAALCIAETEDFETPEVHTAAGHLCFRLRRSGGYKPREIQALAKRLSALAKTREVYTYFKHEDEPTGALNAAAFSRCVLKIQQTQAAGA